jgi:hypothetical protein
VRELIGPPSADDLPGRRPPRKQRRVQERAAKRKRGNQPGAPGTAMNWAEPDQVLGAFTEQYSAFWLGDRSLESMREFGILPRFAGVVVSDRPRCWRVSPGRIWDDSPAPGESPGSDSIGGDPAQDTRDGR